MKPIELENFGVFMQKEIFFNESTKPVNFRPSVYIETFIYRWSKVNRFSCYLLTPSAYSLLVGES